MKTYCPGGAKSTVVHDAAPNYLTLPYKQNKNTPIHQLVVFLQNIVTFKPRDIFKCKTFVGTLHNITCGPPKILVGWATMHLAPPIIGLHVR